MTFEVLTLIHERASLRGDTQERVMQLKLGFGACLVAQSLRHTRLFVNHFRAGGSKLLCPVENLLRFTPT